LSRHRRERQTPGRVGGWKVAGPKEQSAENAGLQKKKKKKRGLQASWVISTLGGGEGVQ